MTNIDAGGAVYTLSLQDDLSRELQAALSEAVSGIKSVTAQIDKEIKAVGQSIQDVGKSIRNLGAGVGLAGAGIIGGLVNATFAAGDFAETVSKFETVFSSQVTEVRKWGKAYADEVGRSEKQLLSFLAQSQDTLVPLGFDERQATELSKTLSTLAVDLASFNDMSDTEAFERLMSAVVGNTETLRKFGVVAQEAEIKAKALQLGFDPTNLTAYQKAMAIIEITLDGTTKAQGDATRTAGSFNNSIKQLKSAFSDLKTAIGKPLLGIAAAFAQGAASIVKQFSSILERFPILVKGLASVAFAMGAIGAAAGVVGVAIAAFGKLIAGAGIIAVAASLKLKGLEFTLKALLATLKLSTASFSLSAALGKATVSAATLTAKLGLLLKTLRTISVTEAFKGLVSGSKFAAKGTVTVFKNMRGAIAGIFGGLSRLLGSVGGQLAKSLVTPAGAAIAVVASAAAVAKQYYKDRLDFEKRLNSGAKGLEVERVKALAKTYREMGKEVPTDLFKTLDVSKAVRIDPKPLVELTQTQLNLANEIRGLKSPLEAFKERISDAKTLLERGEISQDQFDAFKTQATKDYRSADPRFQAIEQLRTPLEIFKASVAEARELFQNDSKNLNRALVDAAEKFRATDPAAQAKLQLRTPAETLQAEIRKANQLFRDDPESRSRAIEQARNQFKATDPAEQFKAQLMTPAERFREAVERARKLFEDQPEYFKRALAAARKEFEASKPKPKDDPAAKAAQQIRESLKSDAQKVAEQIAKAAQLVNDGKLGRDEAAAYAKQLRENFLGDAPGTPDLQQFATRNAAIASNVGSFAPTARDDKSDERAFRKKQLELSKKTAEELQRIRQKPFVFT
ncbi:hypothetical protein [Roseiconus lacunae]|uniref:hypothetical protein n=1 Tax=Roseiconus lacunae TaxID=2605694 RepID=UPI0011F0B74D|nr:hypothetical protein [Roseiconus lacunae]